MPPLADVPSTSLQVAALLCPEHTTSHMLRMTDLSCSHMFWQTPPHPPPPLLYVLSTNMTVLNMVFDHYSIAGAWSHTIRR